MPGTSAGRVELLYRRLPVGHTSSAMLIGLDSDHLGEVQRVGGRHVAGRRPHAAEAVSPLELGRLPGMQFRFTAEIDGVERRFLLRQGENLVGSDPACDVRIAAPTVSRHHAVLVVTAKGLQIADLGSSNGTLAVGRPVRGEPVGIEAGDAIAFGTVVGRIEAIVADDAVSARSEASGSTAAPAGPPAAAPAAVDPRTTVSTHAAQLFTLGHLPRLTAALADGRSGAAFAMDLGTALFGSLPCRSLEIRRGPRSSPVFSAGGAADGVPDRVGDDELEVVAVFDSVAAARLYRPMLEVALHLARLAGLAGGRQDGAPDADRRTAPEATGVPSVVPEVQRLFSDAAKIARGEVHVLILGESGTGKELMARYVHDASPRSAGPLVAVNCAALPQELLESELFGIEKGVATGVDPRPGTFEIAHGGTLFLDEIGDMAAEVQAKILRVLEERRVCRIGGTAPRPADVRVVSATNRDIAGLLASGGFRHDLYHRIAGWEVRLPPLRDRPADIPNLAAHFVEQESARLGVRTDGLSRAALRALIRYQWPGNIRELKREVARAMLFAGDGQLVDTGCLSPRVAAETQRPEGGLRAFLERAERAEIQRALAEHDGHVASAAEALEVPLSTLYRKLKGADPEE